MEHEALIKLLNKVELSYIECKAILNDIHSIGNKTENTLKEIEEIQRILREKNLMTK